MRRRKVTMPDTTTQAQPTRPRPTDAEGRELDGFGLPLSGPARKRRLEELGKPDPNAEPQAWASDAATETQNG